MKLSQNWRETEFLGYSLLRSDGSLGSFFCIRNVVTHRNDFKTTKLGHLANMK